MNSIVWGHGSRTMKIDSGWAHANALSTQHSDDAWEPVAVRGRDHALWLLGDARNKTQAMRDLLPDGSLGNSLHSDHCIIGLIAQKLADRQLLLFRRVTRPAATLSAAALANSPPMAAPQARSASPGAGKKVSAPASHHPAQPDVQAGATSSVHEFASIDQDAQAAALRKAAVTGVPFCALCEELKRQRAAANPSCEAA